MKDENQVSSPQAIAEGTANRRAYAAPKLRRLGSVRELTFGSSPNMSFDAATMASMVAM